MMKIIKASAGSGKTFNLALDYIRILLESPLPDTYRHILAVTFTNKATDEMKSRVLKELHILATVPEESDYYDEFVPKVFRDPLHLREKASRTISSILHDYSSFSVSTIDKFFQQTLRAFSRETGHFSSYQVELDRGSLVRETADRILDSVSDDGSPMLGWLTESVLASLGEGGRMRLEKDVLEMARKVLRPGREEAVAAGGDPSGFTKEKLREIKKACVAIRKEFVKKVSDAASACLEVFHEAGVSPLETKSGSFKALYVYADLRADNTVRYPDTLMKKTADPESWFKKEQKDLVAKLEGLIEGPFEAFQALFGREYDIYTTAGIINSQLYGLGIAKEVRNEFDLLQKEKNIISIDDSNTLLRDIIDGCDAPFIYEKMGVRYEHFLLDEFQDTSTLQWANFRPLIHNSEASGGKNLVVGDVKQSIYRWRGSDWSLLDEQVPREFNVPKEKIRTLDDNYRTLKEIVDFNSRFFPFAAKTVDAILGEGGVSRLYADVKQESKVKDKAPGSVRLDFCSNDELVEEMVLSAISEVIGAGGKMSDIAILVRNNNEGEKLASLLIGNGYRVISDDSLSVKSSVTVRRLVSFLALVAFGSAKENLAAAFLARETGIEPPSSYSSLTELCERLIRSLKDFDEALFNTEVPYIMAFMDYVQDWSRTGGNNIPAFLEDWEAADPMITSPRSSEAVRVMTVHKSKGLEFPFVIFPYAEKTVLYKTSKEWAAPDLRDTPLQNLAEGTYEVSLSSSSVHSLFRDAYLRERKMQAVDNLNVFYVALTRAKYGLRVISSLSKSFDRKKADKGDISVVKNLAHILRLYAPSKDSSFIKTGSDGVESYSLGKMYDYGSIEREESGKKPIVPGWPSWPLEGESGARLGIAGEAGEYFAAPPGAGGKHLSARVKGIVLHDIMASVEEPGDIPSAVAASCSGGILPEQLKEEVTAFLEAKVNAAAGKGWFGGHGVLRERDFMTPGGELLRPDRVVLRDDGSVVVIDYKFGSPKRSYQNQVRRYMSLFKDMGYENVSGWLWYMFDDSDGQFVCV